MKGCQWSGSFDGVRLNFGFLKLWDLSGYSERTTYKRPHCQKLAVRVVQKFGSLVSEVR